MKQLWILDSKEFDEMKRKLVRTHSQRRFILWHKAITFSRLMAPAQWLGVKNFENRDKRCEQKENGTIKEKNIKKTTTILFRWSWNYGDDHTDMQDMEGILNKSTQLSLSSLEYCFCLYFVTFTSFIRNKWNFWCERRSHFIWIILLSDTCDRLLAVAFYLCFAVHQHHLR